MRTRIISVTEPRKSPTYRLWSMTIFISSERSIQCICIHICMHWLDFYFFAGAHTICSRALQFFFVCNLIEKRTGHACLSDNVAANIRAFEKWPSKCKQTIINSVLCDAVEFRCFHLSPCEPLSILHSYRPLSFAIGDYLNSCDKRMS